MHAPHKDGGGGGVAYIVTWHGKPSGLSGLSWSPDVTAQPSNVELWIFARKTTTTTAAYTIHDVVPPAIQSSARLTVLDGLPCTQSQIWAAAAQPFCDRLCSGWFALLVHTDSTCTHAKARSNVTDACTRSAILAHDDPHLHNKARHMHKIGHVCPQRVTHAQDIG